jgi:hypothetical protein
MRLRCHIVMNRKLYGQPLDHAAALFGACADTTLLALVTIPEMKGKTLS